MRIIVLAFSYLACAGHGFRPQVTSEQPHGSSYDTVAGTSQSSFEPDQQRRGGVSNSIAALSKLLTASQPAAGWQVTSGRPAAVKPASAGRYGLHMRPSTSLPTSAPIAMMAKKKGRRKKLDPKSSGPTVDAAYLQTAASAAPRLRTSAEKAADPDPPKGTVVADPKEKSKPVASAVVEPEPEPKEESLSELLSRTGIAQEVEPEEIKDPLANIPENIQEITENFFTGGLIISGIAFLLAGLGVTLESLLVVIEKDLPKEIDEVLVKYAQPNLLPILIVVFANSIGLGLLKSLQMNSYGSGVLYREGKMEPDE